jgi:8-oxo-dGTP pyrophosphatase MutT (NUDIX family)
VGGAVDPGESPAQAAVREAREEIGVDIRLVRLLTVLGGPDYEITYPNVELSRFTRALLTATGHVSPQR